jgi:23S rRNA pseudouridine2605 synthase
VLAGAGVAARRTCERLIEEGRVRVNGRVVSRLPVFVDPARDRILVDGKPIARAERRVYVMLSKPERVLAAGADEPGSDRRTVRDLVKHPSGVRLFPVGRLEYDATGLVLLTNDGDLAHRLTHPRFGVPKQFRVLVKGVMTDEAVARVRRDLMKAQAKDARLAGRLLAPRAEIEVVERTVTGTVLGVTLAEGRTPRLELVLSREGHPIRWIEQEAIGPVRLSGVARGQWRELERHEVQALRRAVRSTPRAPVRSEKTTLPLARPAHRSKESQR